MKRFFDPSPLLLTPADIVSTFTGKKREELSLPERVIITFNTGDLKSILNKSKGNLIGAWSHFRPIYRIEKSNTVIIRSYLGGPNIAATVEELSAFGVKEFVLWGYCGGIDSSLEIGNVILVRGALREDGISYHYLKDREAFVYSDWVGAWKHCVKEWGFFEGTVWSCDALYRETQSKIKRYRKMGISAVEMEVASFYAVCKYKEVMGIAFLIISDIFRDRGWEGGFFTKPFKEGVRRLSDFMLKEVVC